MLFRESILSIVCCCALIGIAANPSPARAHPLPKQLPYGIDLIFVDEEGDDCDDPLGGGCGEDAETKAKEDEGSGRASAPSVSPAQPTAPASVSCSDITGTSDSSQSASECKEARVSLKVAQTMRRTDPDLSAKHYREAAAAARRAGDYTFELSIRREAALPNDAFEAEQDPQGFKQRRQTEGETLQRQARTIERGAFDDGSCLTLETAVDYYTNAGRAFASAGAYGRAGVNVRRAARLAAFVKDARKKGRCDRKLGSMDRPTWHGSANGGGSPAGTADATDDQHGCAGMRQRLEAHAPYSGWIEEQMALSGCKPNGTPMDLSDRTKKELDRRAMDLDNED